jgi:hypothetical protein
VITKKTGRKRSINRPLEAKTAASGVESLYMFCLLIFWIQYRFKLVEAQRFK